ncbi:MAG: hypothetical protein ABSD62_10520 [Candidatus Limnocylindrales bacterium]|jgi:hypothetical protein
MTEVTAPQSIAPTPKKRTRIVSDVRVPVYSLLDSLAVAEAIHKKGGGSASNDQLAAFLGYKSAKNGSYLSRVATARIFDFITGQGDRLTITPRAQSILMPVYTHDARQALVKAFLDVPLYKAVYDEYFGKELPTPFGMTNAFRTHFGVAPSRVEAGLRALMESAEQAGFFEVRGTRTQLIIPKLPDGFPRKITPQEEGSEEPQDEQTSGGGGGSRNPPPPPKTPEDLKNEYISTLIGVLREKGSSGEVDGALMERIEKLLGLPQ